MHKITEATLADLENHFLFWPDLKKKTIFEIRYLRLHVIAI